MMPWRIFVGFSEYFLGRLRGDREFTLYRDCVLSLERLYGRAPELAIRLIAFGRVLAGGREFILRSGYSGIGQSAIFNESPNAADH